MPSFLSVPAVARDGEPQVFPFLALPREVRQMVYVYALTTRYGLWLDVYRRELPKIMTERGTVPPESVVHGAKASLRGIITPELLSTCRQICQEAKYIIWRNQIRLDRFSWQHLDHIPALTTGAIRDLYIGDGTQTWPVLKDGCKPTDPRHLRIELPGIPFKKFTWLKHFTIHFTLEDSGLLGKKTHSVRSLKETKAKIIPLDIISLTQIRFKQGRLRTIALECHIIYPSKLYPWVLVWSFVEELAHKLLPLRAMHQLQPMREKFTEYLGMPNLRDQKPRNYELLLSQNFLSNEIKALYRKMEVIWARNGVRVYTRDPNRFERGTMLVFERTHDDLGVPY